MPRFLFALIAAVGLLCAGAGIWFDGLRSEMDIARTLERFPRPNDTPFLRCADSYYWMSYAREMIDSGKLRVRFTHLDNAPYGRPNIGWASLNAWYLVALAKAWSMASGETVRDALRSTAVWANPILYFLALATILMAGWRLENFPVAVFAVLILGTAPRVYDDFAYAVPGHHGWHDIACFGTLIFLAAALRKTESKRWFIAAGVSAAIAIWIGATQQAFGIAAAGAGGLAGMIINRWAHAEKSPADFPTAANWRYFGITAAVGSLFFYLLEYFPGPLSMRLEVNHPLYSFGFLLGGEFLCRAQRLIIPSQRRSRTDLAIAIVLGFALATIPAIIFFGPTAWHTMRQPFMQRVHHEIAEFRPINVWYKWESLVFLGAPILLVILAAYHSLTARPRQRMALLTCAFPCSVAIALSFIQLRWAGIASASAAAVAAVLFADAKLPQAGNESPIAFKHIRLSHALPIFLAIICATIWLVRRNVDDSREVRTASIDRVATMEIAAVLSTDARSKPGAVVFSNQKERQAWIGYATGIPGVGSLYWDSPSGIRDETELLGSYDDETAHRIARERTITHIVTTPNGGSVIAYHYVWNGIKTAPQIRDTLAYRLAEPHPQPPPWLELLPARTPAMMREGIRIYRVL